ncbi:MAG: hypothetical protein ACLPVY_04830 [Acidimicrobiia bacterium]
MTRRNPAFGRGSTIVLLALIFVLTACTSVARSAGTTTEHATTPSTAPPAPSARPAEPSIPTATLRTSLAYTNQLADQSGDNVTMRASIGEPVAPTATGVSIHTLAVQCQNDVDRDMVERIDYKLTVTSPRPIDVILTQAARSSIGSGSATYYATDPSHATKGNGDASICSSESATRQLTNNFGIVRHNQTVTLTVWALLDGSVTPNQPHPTLADLARSYTIEIAGVKSLAFGLEPWGPRVIMRRDRRGPDLGCVTPPGNHLINPWPVRMSPEPLR